MFYSFYALTLYIGCIWAWLEAIFLGLSADLCAIVAAHLRGMWPAPSTDKDILTPNEKLKTQTHN